MRLPLRLSALILAALLASVPAHAQLTAEPESVSATVPQHATTTRTVTLSNTGTEPLTFCLSFDRPLQRTEGQARLAEGAAGGGEPCGPYGEVLYRYDEEDFGAGWSPYGIVMTLEGRLFVAESSGFPWRTFEFTPDLQLIRFFEHPHIAELTPFSTTSGIGFDAKSGTLWWMNAERAGGTGTNTRRILLLEGDLDGVETGRRIEIVPPNEPIDDFIPGGLAYDPATDFFYFSAILGNGSEPESWRLWAVDRAGTVPGGYPLRPEPYPDGLLGYSDAHGGMEGGPEGVRIEYGAYLPFGPGRDHIVVVDRWGHSQGEVLETPVPDVLFEAGGAGIRGNPLRSRIDPNGVMYMTFTNFDHTGIVGVRPHPLPPSWLGVDSDEGPEAAWDGTLAPGESRTLTLTFRPGGRAIGEYIATLQAFEAETGEAVEVPLSMEVTQGTDTEDEADVPEASSLSVYPNPMRGAATVALTLGVASEVRVAVYDVLGREVAVLHEGPLGAGMHELRLNGRSLPSGLYLVRVVGEEWDAVQRVSIVR